MPKPFKTWTVLPHGPLREVDDGILTVVGDIPMPLGQLPRRMTVVRLSDGKLVIYSAIALNEAEMTSLEGYGTPGFLIVPNALHRLDARIWKARYPAMKVIAPAGAAKAVNEIVAVDATASEFNDPSVAFVDVAGTKARESALIVQRESGTTLVVNDIIGNIRDAKGASGFILKIAKFAGSQPHVPRPVKVKLVHDRKALRDQFADWAALPGLRRILVSHGDIIDSEPAAALRTMAASLSA
jgi:hypothetical protein